MINGTGVKHWPRTPATRALSTTEADYHAVITGTAEALGMQSMMTDLGLRVQVRVWTDSNAAKTNASRPWEDQTCGSELLVAAGGDQIAKSENEEGPRGAICGGPFDEGKIVVRT